MVDIIEENKKRNARFSSYYSPYTGEGSPIERKRFVFNGETLYLPLSMWQEHSDTLTILQQSGSTKTFLNNAEQPYTAEAAAAIENWLISERFIHDFEFWAAVTVKILHKVNKNIVPFILNYPQRKMLLALEQMRTSNLPIRLIILKARQWGGSTLSEIYMAWIQLIHKENWNSVIIAHLDNVSRNIRAMYSRLLTHYPSLFGQYSFAGYEGSTNTRQIKERGCIISVGSAQAPETSRSYDIMMAHFSEVGMYKTTQNRTPEEIVQAVRASIPELPYTVEILESTAKGVGTFFHREWLSAIRNESGYYPLFIAWWEIEMYNKPIDNYRKFIKWLQSNTYAMHLWQLGATLEGINWYFNFKRSKNYSEWMMYNEMPSTPEEAFVSSGIRAIDPQYVLQARAFVCPPALIGDISGSAVKGSEALSNIHFTENPLGNLKIWSEPDTTEQVANRYIVSVDIGGRSSAADWSIIKVIDRYWLIEGGAPETVALWRGHLDQDIIAWKAAQIASWYNNALLVVEVNSLHDKRETYETTHHITILSEIADTYDNIYSRKDTAEVITDNRPTRYGFHTNRSTKPALIDNLNALLRDNAFVERDEQTLNEMDTYEIKPNGSFGAVDGCHDDLLMATAIGLWVCFKEMELPQIITTNTTYTPAKPAISEASF